MSTEIDPKTLAVLAQALQAVQQTQVQPEEDDWADAEEPMEIELGTEVGLGDYEARILSPDENIGNIKILKGFPTGTFIDEMFLDHEAIPIGGIPVSAQLAMTGLAGAGKSILISEIAVKVAARGEKVLLVTSEDVFQSDTDRFDLQSRLMQKATILGLDWMIIKDNLLVIDAVSNPEIRHWKDFAETYRYACEAKDIKLALIDSVTMLEDRRGQLKFRLMEICRFNQDRGITCIMVNQRTKETWDAYEMAGGHAIAHAVDGTIIVDYGRTYHADQVAELGKRGTSINMVRIMDMRLCNFMRDRVPVEITSDGFLRKAEAV